MPGQEQDRGTGQNSGLRAALHGEAARHTPDREYILRRVAQAGPADRREPTNRPDQLRSPVRRSMRLSGAGAALGSLLLAGGAAAWAMAAFQQDDRPSIRISEGPLGPADGGGATTAAHPVVTGRGSTPPSGASRPPAGSPPPAATRGTAAAGTPEAPDPVTTSGVPVVEPPGGATAGVITTSTGAATSDHFLWVQGAVDQHSTATWTQSNVTVRTSVPLRTLQIEVRIARTAGVQHTGDWTTLNPAELDEEVVDSDSEIVYRFTLRQGAVVQPGEYQFSVQFHHAQGDRDVSQDRYTVSASGQDNTAGSAAVNGRFG